MNGGTAILTTLYGDRDIGQVALQAGEARGVVLTAPGASAIALWTVCREHWSVLVHQRRDAHTSGPVLARRRR
jgi:hypothetical protein